MSGRARRALTAVALALGLATASACASTTGSGGDDASAGNGPATAELDQLDPEPIADVQSPQLPVTVESFDGEEVTITDASRIVAVDRNGTLGETVFALGLGDNMVGRDIATDFPAAADIPNVTPGGHALNAEAIMALEPTVVLTDSTLGPRSAQMQLRAAGIPVVFFDPERTVETVGPQIQAVADALGVPDAGAALAARTETEIDEAIASVPDLDEPPTIAFLYQRGTAVSLLGGPGGGSDALIEAIGGIDAGTAAGLTQEYTPVTSEALIVAAPDAILMMSDGLSSINGIDGLTDVPGIAQTPAGKNRWVVDMEDSQLLSFGPNTGKVIRALVDAFYGPQE